MLNHPQLLPVKLSSINKELNEAIINEYDVLIIILPKDKKLTKLNALAFSKSILNRIKALKDSDSFSFTADNQKCTHVTIDAFINKSRYENLVWARKLIDSFTSKNQDRIGLLALDDDQQILEEITQVLYLATSAKSFKLDTFFSDPKKLLLKKCTRLLEALHPVSKETVTNTSAYIEGNNLARWLTALPPNILDAKAYIRFLKTYASDYKIDYELFTEKKLSILNAGAFLAVSQGNYDRNAGIVKLSYLGSPKKSETDLAIVGKGIIFDTGGTNMKPFQHMLDMHIDMEGSAVALGLLHALKKIKAKINIEVWLAITENRVSARSYKSQDIITASNGVTIQTIHTDAEGRMVLADTLALACKAKPKWVIDFATLTGTCESALTTKYAGVFTNKQELNDTLIQSGLASGERVWPFPMDNDFLELIESDIADVKQCPESGGGDHIAAAKFLEKFISKDITWVHTDLSSGFTKSGLAHIPTQITGFGIGFGLELLRKVGKI
jgi:leucyl aminopeptidase